MATIFKKRGVWFLDYYINNQRKRKSLKTDSKKLAELALHDLEVKLAKNDLGLLVKDKNIYEFVTEFLEWKKSRVAESSFRRIELVFRLHIKPFMQEHNITSLRQVTSWLLEKFVTRRASKAKSQTLNREIKNLKEFFKMATKWNLLQQNPALDVKLLRVDDQKPPRFLTEQEIALLLENTEGIIRLMTLTALNTGLRYQELLNLEWQDIDLQKNILRVANDERRQTKNKRTRHIPLKQSLKTELQKHRGNIGRVDSTTGVFASPQNKRLSYFRECLMKTYKRTGIENACVHTLRHTFASHLVMQGVDIYTVSKLLGHSDVKMTQIYAHLAPDHLKGAVEKLPDFGHPKDTSTKTEPICANNSVS